MKKINTLKKNYEFSNVIKRGNYHVKKQIIVYITKNNKNKNIIGIAISTKLCNAVNRNKIKRIIRESYYREMKKIKQGYNITAVDGSKELSIAASKIIGQEVICSKFEELKLTEKFHGIWACASLLHINKRDLSQVIKNISSNLEHNGVFYMSFKYGEDEYIDEKGRYFNCYTEGQLLSQPEAAFKLSGST